MDQLEKEMPGRRKFIRTAALGMAAAPLAFKGADGSAARGKTAAPASHKFPLGLASYTLRAFDLDQVIDMTRRVGLERVGFKDMDPAHSSTRPRRHGAALAPEAFS